MGYFWALGSIPLISMSILTSVLHRIDYWSFEIMVEIRMHESSTFGCLLRDRLSYSGALKFPHEFQDQSLNF